MGEGERRAGGVQAAVSSMPAQPPLTSPPGALEMLFREHHGAVYRAAYRITGSAMDAEDVLQTVFTRLLRREEQPDLSESAGSYLHRAAVNAALDLMRRRKRSRRVDLDEVGDDLVDTTEPGPERAQGNRELKVRLREAMSRLSPPGRDLLPALCRGHRQPGDRQDARRLADLHRRFTAPCAAPASERARVA